MVVGTDRNGKEPQRRTQLVQRDELVEESFTDQEHPTGSEDLVQLLQRGLLVLPCRKVHQAPLGDHRVERAGSEPRADFEHGRVQ
jgi:hypothetical protein